MEIKKWLVVNVYEDGTTCYAKENMSDLQIDWLKCCALSKLVLFCRSEKKSNQALLVESIDYVIESDLKQAIKLVVNIRC